MGILDTISDNISLLLPWVIVDENEAGVLLRFGRYRYDLYPGFKWKIPIFDRALTANVTSQQIDLPCQSITLQDGRSLVISGTIRYTIRNARKALLGVQDYDESLQECAMGLISTEFRGVPKDFKDFLKIEKDIEGIVSERALSWGMRVEDFFFTDFAEHWCVRMVE